jgi:hypothetical protein
MALSSPDEARGYRNSSDGTITLRLAGGWREDEFPIPAGTPCSWGVKIIEAEPQSCFSLGVAREKADLEKKFPKWGFTRDGWGLALCQDWIYSSFGTCSDSVGPRLPQMGIKGGDEFRLDLSADLRLSVSCNGKEVGSIQVTCGRNEVLFPTFYFSPSSRKKPVTFRVEQEEMVLKPAKRG